LGSLLNVLSIKGFPGEVGRKAPRLHLSEGIVSETFPK